MNKLSLDLTVSRYPDNIAICTSRETVTYRQLAELVRSVVRSLQSEGIAMSDLIGIVAVNSIDTIVSLYALWHIGAVACILNRRWPQSMVDDACKTVGCRLIDVVKRESGQHAEQEQDVIYNNDSHATVIFTSGSTGRPKGVVHTFGNHLYSALGSNENIRFGSNDRWLLSLPLCHVGGLSILFRALIVGGTVVVDNKQQALCEIIERHNVTHCSLVPTQLRSLVENAGDYSLTSLKAVLAGGASVPDKLVVRAKQLGLPIFTTYGMTEMASQVTTTEADMSENAIGSSGRLLPYREMKIGKQGEILVRGKTLTIGYIEDRAIQPLVDDDGWYHTGDTGKFDAEKRMRVLGRLDNMFISGGENIQPEQIEKALLKFDEITQALVVPVKDQEFGERPVAFIDLIGNKSASELHLANRLREKLPGFMIPIKFFDWPKEMVDIELKVRRAEFAELANKLIADQLT